MASLNKEPNGNYTVQLVGSDGKRRSLRLGKVPKKSADSIKLRVESLHACAVAGLPWDADLASWVASLGEDLAAKLAGLGLMPARQAAVTLAGLLDLYAAEKDAANKPGTRAQHRSIAGDLVGFFDPTRDPRAVTPAEAEAFVSHLTGRGLAPATVARRLRRVRTVFAFAVKKGLAGGNPFADAKAASSVGAENKFYVGVPETERLLAVANPIWRIIIALSRFAGLRCPSEVLSLRWKDIDLAGGSMRVTVPKLDRIPGRGHRACPIFTALRPYLEEAFAQAGAGEVFVVGGPQGDKYRLASQGPNGWVNCNLRTTFLKVIRKAGLTAWPRLFHNLRASCETDLLAELPIASVTAWIGHSAEVALKHYAQVRTGDFDRAAGRRAVQNAVQLTAEVGQIAVQSQADASGFEGTDSEETRGDMVFSGSESVRVCSKAGSVVTRLGFEPSDRAFRKSFTGSGLGLQNLARLAFASDDRASRCRIRIVPSNDRWRHF